MDAQRSNDLSRRTVLLGIGASGLGAAFVTQQSQAVNAQDATPSADSGMPEGTGFELLGNVPIRDMPTEPFAIVVSRLTMEPGSEFPNSALPHPSMTYVEEGTGLICPPGGEGRFITDAEGNPVDSGADEMAFPLGTWCYTAPNTMDGLRNDGSDRASILSIELVPTES